VHSIVSSDVFSSMDILKELNIDELVKQDSVAGSISLLTSSASLILNPATHVAMR